MRIFCRRLILIWPVATCLGWLVSLILSANLSAAAPSGPDFRTPDSQLSNPLRILVYGDVRFTDPHETLATNPTVRRWIINQMVVEKPDAILVSGDVPWRGAVAGDYDVYRSETQVWRDAHLRIIPALGNHELLGGWSESQCLENWWKAFPELRGRRRYSVQLGSTVYILNLDSNSSLLPGSEQMGWIKSELSALPASVRFVFFNMHYPPVVDVQVNGDPDHNGRPNERALAEFLAAAPERSRVRFIVSAGHIHNYERFFQDGVVYLVSGGGGAEPRPLVRGPSDLYQDPAFPNYHYVRLVVDGNNLAGTMIRVANPGGPSPKWQEKDHFVIPAPARAASARK